MALAARPDGLNARWLSPDPIAGDPSDPGSLNRYAYVLNNPTNFVDPLGLFEYSPAPPPTFPLWTKQAAYACQFDPLGFICQALTDRRTDWGGGGGGTSPAPKEKGVAENDAAKPCGSTGFGFGVGGAGDFDLGIWKAGLSAKGSAVSGFFFGGPNGVSPGALASGVAVAYAGSRVADAPTQGSQAPRVFGGFGGVGASLFFTNAASVGQLAGIAKTLSFNVGYSFAQLNVEYARSGDIWALTVSGPKMGLGWGFSIAELKSKTVTTGAACE